MENIDNHPLRYSHLVTRVIEPILFKRELERRPNGYVRGTLETAIEIAEAVTGLHASSGAEDLREKTEGAIIATEWKDWG